MYKESGCLRGKTQRFPWGAEVREAESPLLGGDRLHCRVCRFLKIKTGPETAHRFGGWCPPTPAAIPKSVLHSVPSICRAVLVNIPFLKKEEESTEKNKKKTTPNSSATLPAHSEDARARGRGRRSQFPCPSHSHSVRGGLPSLFRPPPGGRLLAGETGVGLRRGLQGGSLEEEAVLGTQRPPSPGCSASSPGRALKA